MIQNIFYIFAEQKISFVEIDLQNWASKSGFEVLFRKFYERLCSYAFTFVADKDACEDIVQEVFVKLWDNRNETDIETSVKSYLYQAVKHACLNSIKHIDVSYNYKKYNQNEIEYDQLLDEDTITAKELEERIRLNIENLPPERKKIFILSRYENLKYKEIADQLGISIKTVENQMGKALATLRKELVEYLPTLIAAFLSIFR